MVVKFCLKEDKTGKSNLKVFLLGFVMIFLLFSCGREKQYNFLIITIDALRADHLSCYGYKYNTSPEIDKFAEKAIIYEDAFCPIPKTSASLASMLTGLHPMVHKTKPNLGTLKDKFLTIAELLKMKGYETGASVFNGNLDRSFGFNQGFDFYDEVWKRDPAKGNSAKNITEAAIKFIKEKKGKKFFLWLHYIDPHAPYIPPPEYFVQEEKGININSLKKRIVVGLGRKNWINLEKNPLSGYYLSLYDGEIRRVDHYVGEVLKFIEKQGLKNKTVIIISADHGEELGKHNFFFGHGPLAFNSSIRIPMIVWIPGKRHRKSSLPVSNMDIYPTITQLLSLRLPYDIQGTSLLSPRRRRKLLILALGGHALISYPYKLVVTNDKFASALGINKEYLFNIEKDPLELNPLQITPSIGIEFFRLSRRFNEVYENISAPYFSTWEKKKRKLPRKTIENLKTLGYL